MSLFLTALGLVMIFEGIPYFCFPTQFKAFAQKIPELSNSTLRYIGLVLLFSGLLFVYLGRSLIDNG